jgi:hypothetical protein
MKQADMFLNLTSLANLPVKVEESRANADISEACATRKQINEPCRTRTIKESRVLSPLGIHQALCGLILSALTPKMNKNVNDGIT